MSRVSQQLVLIISSMSFGISSREWVVGMVFVNNMPIAHNENLPRKHIIYMKLLAFEEKKSNLRIVRAWKDSHPHSSISLPGIPGHISLTSIHTRVLVLLDFHTHSCSTSACIYHGSPIAGWYYADRIRHFLPVRCTGVVCPLWRKCRRRRGERWFDRIDGLVFVASL